MPRRRNTKAGRARLTPQRATKIPLTTEAGATVAAVPSMLTEGKRGRVAGPQNAGEDSTIIAVGIEEHIVKPHSTRWSARVTQQSNALTLEKGVFTKRSSRQIALSLKRSAERSSRRKSAPFRSAMSMLNFYINRMGTQLSGTRRKVLERAKSDLRELFGKGD